MTKPLPDDEPRPEVEQGSDVVSEEAEVSAIQIDGYKVKARIDPVDTGEAAPKSWKAVWRSVNLKLMSIVVNVFGFVDDCLHGSRNIVRGLGKIPPRAERTAKLAHAKSDRKEALRQEKAASGESKLPSPSKAAERAESVLSELRADGLEVLKVELGDGRVAILIVKPEDREIAARLAKQGLPPPKRQSKRKPMPGEPGPPAEGKSASESE